MHGDVALEEGIPNQDRLQGFVVKVFRAASDTPANKSFKSGGGDQNVPGAAILGDDDRLGQGCVQVAPHILLKLGRCYFHVSEHVSSAQVQG